MQHRNRHLDYLQSFIDTHSNPFVLVDENYTIVAANRSYVETYGHSGDELIGRKCHRVSHLFDQPCFMNHEACPLGVVLETNERYEVLHIHYDQHNRPERVRIRGYPITGADGTRYVGEEVIRLGRTGELDCEEQQLIARSAAFRKCINGISSAAVTDTNILLTGEPGAGKGLAARHIHSRSRRSGRAFVTLHCDSVNESLFESELFGHERGAFAGCVGRRRGLLGLADGGTLYLDEVGELPLPLQGSLLNAIETGKYRRVGGRKMLEARVRIIASTRSDLPAMIAGNRFRSDLYHRLSGIVQHIPSLRERREDIPALADALLTRLDDPRACSCHIDEDARKLLVEHEYPGNIRELRNILQRAVSRCADGHIRAEHIDSGPRHGPAGTLQVDENRSIGEMESRRIAELLGRHHGHRRRVAEELGISERTLYRKLVKYGLGTIGR